MLDRTSTAARERPCTAVPLSMSPRWRPDPPATTGVVVYSPHSASLPSGGRFAMRRLQPYFLLLLTSLMPASAWSRDCVEFRDSIHLLGSIQISDGDAMAVSGPYVYVHTRFGLEVIDASDPSNRVFKGRLQQQCCTRGLATTGLYAYGVDGLPYVTVVDVSDPIRPTWKGLVPVPAGAIDIASSTTHLYVLSLGGVHVYDLSNPMIPELTGTLWGDEARYGRLVVDGGIVYVIRSGPDGGLSLVDVSDP